MYPPPARSHTPRDPYHRRVAKGDERLSTGRTKRPADSVPGHGPVPRSAERLGVKLGHAFGERLDRAVRSRHRRRAPARRLGARARRVDARLRRAATFPARRATVSTCSSTAPRHCPRSPTELARAESFVHLTGWFFSPELHLSRDDEPVIVRNLLAELAERVDVRVLSWKGAPVPALQARRSGDVREMLDEPRPPHEDRSARGRLHRVHALPSREDDRDRRPRRVRRRHRPHARRGRSVGHADARRARRDRLARRCRADRGAGGRRRRAALPAALARRDAGAACRARRRPSRRATSRRRSCARCPRGRIARRAAATTRSSSRTSARFAPPSASSTSRTSSSGRPRSSAILADKLANPPSDDFRVARAAARAGERRRRHLARPGRRAHPRRRRDDALPRVHDLRAGGEAPRPRLRPREDRDRRRPLAHGRLGEPERALAVQRHRDERRHARSRCRASDAASPLVGAPRAPARGRRRAIPIELDRRALGAHRRRSSSSCSRAARRSRIGSSSCPVSRGAGGACSARCRAGSTTSDRRATGSSPSSRALLGDLGRLLDRGAEHEEAAAEGDRADAEPAPSRTRGPR